jgi:spore coat protein U-like protein
MRDPMKFAWRALFTAVVSVSAVAGLQRPAHAAAACQFSSATIAFGVYDVYGGELGVAGSIAGICTKGANKHTQPTLTLDTGANSATFATRKMRCTSGPCLTNYATDSLQYNLYTTAAYTTVWGDGTGGTGTYQFPSGCCDSGTPFRTPVYGLIPAATAGGINDVAVGGYTDTVLVTMTF